MPVFDATDSVKLAGRTPTRGAATSFGENFAASFNAFAEGQQFVSKQANTLETTQKMFDTLKERGVSPSKIGPPPVPGDLSATTFDQEVAKFFKNVRSIAEENPELLEGLPTSIQEMNKGIAAEVRQAEREAEDVAFRASTLGGIGGFAGTAAGAIVDPPVLASMALGAPASAGILRTALAEGAIGAAVEVPIQASVQASRAELGLDAGVGKALKNIAAAGVGGAVFGGAFRAVGRGAGRAVRAVQERRAAKVQRQTLGKLAAEVERNAPQAVRTSPELKSAVNHAKRFEDIQQQNPFPREVPKANETFRRGFDAVMRSVQETGTTPSIRTSIPVPDEVRRATSLNVDLLDQVAAASARGSGPDADPATRAAQALGDALRGQVDRRFGETDRLQQTQSLIGRIVDDAPDQAELGRTLQAGSRLEEQAQKVRQKIEKAQQEGANRGVKAAATKARNNFRARFQQEFPDATVEDAEAFLRGETDLSAAVSTIREAGAADEAAGGDVFSLAPEQIADTLRQFSRPLQEEVAAERSLTDLQAQRAETQRILDNPDERVAQMRASLQQDLNQNQQVRVVDDDGTERTTTIGDLLRGLDEDEKVVRAVNDCLGRTS